MTAAKSEVRALVKRLAIPVEPGWKASIWLGLGVPQPVFGMMRGPQVHVVLAFGEKPEWKVQVETVERSAFSCAEGFVSRDDLGLPPLPRLENVPRSIVDAGDALDVRFSVPDARIDAGKHRGSADLLRAWLASGRG